MCEAYAVRVEDLRKALGLFSDIAKKELLEYVPLGDNYCANYCANYCPDYCASESDDPDSDLYSDFRYVKNYNKLRILNYDTNIILGSI